MVSIFSRSYASHHACDSDDDRLPRGPGSDDSVSDRRPQFLEESDPEPAPFSDSETLILPGGVDPEEHQWWYYENWALETDVYFGFGPGKCRWVWDQE